MTTLNDLLLIEESCSVTAFDMKFQVSKDGRKRGLWFILEDSSKSRIEHRKRWCEEEATSDREKYSTNDSALIEWKELKKIHNAIGKELKNLSKIEKKLEAL